MFGRRILFLAAGYVVGNAVSSVYSAKKGKEVQADMKKRKNDGHEGEVVLSNILETQKNLFSDLGKMVPKEYQKTFQAYKKELTSLFYTVKDQGEAALKSLDDSPKESTSATAKKDENTKKQS